MREGGRGEEAERAATHCDPAIVAVEWDAEERGVGTQSEANVEETLGGGGQEADGEGMMSLL